MVLNIGGFAFKQLDSINISSDFSISTIDRIQNHQGLLALFKPKQTISLSGQTLPFRGDKQKALKKLYSLASLQQSYPLVNGADKYFGEFAISKIEENQSRFTNTGAFFIQNFTIELIKDYT